MPTYNYPKEMSVPTDRIIQMRDEILSLRRTNEILTAKVSVIEIFGDAIHAQVQRGSMGMSEDIVCTINRALDEAEKKEKSKTEEAGAKP